MKRVTIDPSAPNPAFDNSDILSPSSALQLMTDRVLEELQARGIDLKSPRASTKAGDEIVKIPMGFKRKDLRDVYNRILRMLSLRDAGSPPCINIREEFEISAVTAYRANSHHVFYIASALRAFTQNLSLDIDKTTVGYELHVSDSKFSQDNAQTAYVIAFDNVLRFHPLYVAYLYGASGDIARENILIAEAVDYMAWLFTKG